MKINKTALLIALAKSCMNPHDLCEKTGITYQTYNRLVKGKKCKTATAGIIAAALGVDVEAIIILED